jgi:dipeptidyl aminopeptidase/acylaminoacyl peptidase
MSRPFRSYLLLLLACAATSLAQARHRISLDDILRLHIPDDPQCSPDGQSVVYTASQPDGKARVWMIKYDGSGNHPLTSGVHGEYRPRLSADGKYLSYLSSSRLWLQPLNGNGGARAIADALSYEWSPDATTLAIVAGDSATSRGARIYLYSLATQRLSPLTHQQASEESQPSWSPDGKAIAFIADHQVAVGEAIPGAPYKRISESNATRGAHIDWSHDGKTLAFLVGEERRLAIAPADGSAQPRLIRSAVDLDRGGWAPSWGDSGNAVYATVADDMSVNGFRMPINDADHATPLFERPVVLGARHHAGGCAAVISSGDTKPDEILALDDGALRPVTHLNDHLVADFDWPKTEEVKFASKDGTDVHGLLTYPVGYKAGVRVPLLLRIHGGPFQQDDHSFSPEVQYFAANDYAVLRINYRGSDGRGSSFLPHDAAIDDLEAGLDYAIRAGIADSERLGLEAWGYGAALAESLIAGGRTRFKAVIVGPGQPADTPLVRARASHAIPSLVFVERPTPTATGGDLRAPKPLERQETDGTQQVVLNGTVRARYQRSLAWFDRYLRH